MPVTKTAKRALRGSKKKAQVNISLVKRLEASIRLAKKSKAVEKINAAISLADRAAKKRFIHKNRAARIKSTLSKLLPKKSEGRKTQKTQKIRKSARRKIG